MRSTSSEVDFQSKSRPDYFTQMSAIDPPPPSPQSKEKADKLVYLVVFSPTQRCEVFMLL